MPKGFHNYELQGGHKKGFHEAICKAIPKGLGKGISEERRIPHETEITAGSILKTNRKQHVKM